MTALADTALATLGEALQRMAEVDPLLGVAALAFHVTNHLLRSVAWRAVLSAAYPDARPGITTVAAAYAAGVALNAVAPARGGDAAKVALMRGAIPGSSVPTIAASMSVLVVFDVVLAGVLVVIVGLAGVAPVDPSAVGRAGVVQWLSAHIPMAAGLAALACAGALMAWRVARRRIALFWSRLRQGGAILHTPLRYVRDVALVQVAAWCCRVGVIFCLLAAFHLPASVPLAAFVMVLCGASTVVPLTPGGAGTQQVMLAYALSQTASAAAVVSFSVGMQAGVTAVNALLGMVAAMAVCRTLRPLAAVRATVGAARAGAG